MKTLVIGGTGMIGTHIAAHLSAQGHEVTVAGRSRPAPGTAATAYPALCGDYTTGGFTTEQLAPFEAVVFAAGNDIRHIPAGVEPAEFWEATQVGGVPRFAAAAKKAGVRRFVQIGSYYHQLMPELAEQIPYVRARRDADDGARALADETFAPITLNPPSIVGVATPRARRGFAKMAQWLRGEAGAEPWAPEGGTNYMSVESLTQAVIGALYRGEGGKGYLIGDESLAYRDYFQRIIDLTGGTNSLEVRDEEHPLQPDRFIVQGRGATIAYEPDPAEVELLGYDRQDVTRALTAIFATEG